jgi:hypothetical protein
MTLTALCQNKQFSCALKLSLIALAALCALVFLPVQTALAADGAQVTVESPSDVAPGDEFTATVSLSGNPGFMGAVFILNYDSSAVELLSIDKSGAFSDIATVNQDANLVSFMNFAGDTTGDGDLFKANFRVRDDASDGNYTIAVTLKDGTPKNFVNSEAEAVPISFVDSTGNITDGTEVGPNDPGTGGTGGGGGTGTGGSTTPGGGTTTPPTVDGKTVTDTVDVKNPTTGSQAGTVGIPFFVEAAEGSLSWDANQYDGYYDSAAGGYVLTPKTEGASELTYTDENGETKTIPVEIAASETPLAKAGNGFPILPVVIVVVLIIAIAIVGALVLNKRKNETLTPTPTSRHSK